MTQVPNKQWYQSKSLWFNSLTGFIAIGELANWTDLLTNVQLQIMALAVASANIVLRILTVQPVTFTNEPKTQVQATTIEKKD